MTEEERAKIKETFDLLFAHEGRWEGKYLIYEIPSYGFTMTPKTIGPVLKLCEEHNLGISVEADYEATTRAGYLAYDSEVTVYLNVEIG